MSVAQADLKAYQAANMPEDDVSAAGGAIVTTGLVEFTPMAANDTLEAVSDNAADTMNLTIVGRAAGGAIVSETRALTGTSTVGFVTNTLERVLKIILASAAAGTVTVRRSSAGPTVVAIPAGKTSVRRLFYDSASEAGSTTRYEKIFLKNENGTDTLNSAAVELTADPSSAIRVGVAAAKDDSGSVANRKTSPGVTFVDDGVSQSVPGGTLAAGEAIGVWVEMVRGAGAAPVKSTFTVQLSGTTV